MAGPSMLSSALNAARDATDGIIATSANMLLSPGSAYSLVGLSTTLAIAAAFTLWRRGSKRAVPLRALVRALLPRRLWRSASGRTDLLFTLFNVFLGMALFGWAIIGQAAVSSWTSQIFHPFFGTTDAPPLSPAGIATITTIALFLAYEFAYWFDHYLSHKLPFLWQFHAVHHSAESLSLATNFRVHPVDTIVFYNLVALCTGATAGLLDLVLGKGAMPFAIAGSNVLLMATAVLLTHLHHSHLWICFGKRWGRLLLSPAHHQIHHSADPAHHDRNFGSSLAIFDWLFGTLYVPAAQREKLTFGVSGLTYHPHSFFRSFYMPFLGAAEIVRSRATSAVQLFRLPGFRRLVDRSS